MQQGAEAQEFWNPDPQALDPLGGISPLPWTTGSSLPRSLGKIKQQPVRAGVSSATKW